MSIGQGLWKYRLQAVCYSRVYELCVGSSKVSTHFAIRSFRNTSRPETISYQPSISELRKYSEMTFLSTREQGVALVAGINCMFYFMPKLRSNACIAIQPAHWRLLLSIPVNVCCSGKFIATLSFRSQSACKTQFDTLQGSLTTLRI
jgi:hypothetical protein